MPSDLRDFLEIPYDRLEEMNLEAKAERLARVSPAKLRDKRMKYLAEERRIKAVTVCFADLEGRLHMLDYDKKFLLKSADNLTFDGSSIRGFSQQAESDRARTPAAGHRETGCASFREPRESEFRYARNAERQNASVLVQYQPGWTRQLAQCVLADRRVETVAHVGARGLVGVRGAARE